MANKTALVMRATGVQVIARLPFNPSESKSTCTRAHRRKDPSTIEAVLKGCQALLFVQLPSFTDDAELQEARVVLKLAKDAGVQQVVFSSSLVLNNPNAREDLKELSAAPAVTKKAAVEDLVKASGMLGHYFVQDMQDGRLVNSYGPDCVLTLVDPDDIGAFVSAAFNDPNKYDGETITVVGENMLFADMIDEFSKDARGDQKETASPFISGQVLCIGLNKLVDMEEVKKWGISLSSFKQFLEKRKDEFPRGGIPESASTSVPFSESQMTANK